MRIESNLRRLEGVRAIHSSLADGTVTVQWRPGIRLDLARLKEGVLRWRGAVRYGGAVVTVVGVIGEAEVSAAGVSSVPLRTVGTGQPFRLQLKGGSPDLSQWRR